MRILQINKFFHVRGGADGVFFKTCDLLAEHGHEVAHFSSRHAKNRPSPYERYFVDGFNEDDLQQVSFQRKVRAFVDGIYSLSARRNIRALVAEFKPDVAHVHNLNYQLSPSIFDALHEAGVPIVMTLHDYGPICGAATMYLNGEICERCCGGSHYQVLIQRCFHGSYAASAMVMLNKYVHEARHSWRQVSLMISPSRFLRGKLVEYGAAEERIVHLPNFVDFEAGESVQPQAGGYVLYLGRLSLNKGTETLLKATRGLNASVVLLGDGPMRAAAEAEAASRSGQLRVHPFTSSRAEIQKLIADSAFVVVPSEWYENQPTTILEAYWMRKPVIASRLGGIPELVEDGKTGLLFEPGDAADLRNKIDYLLAHSEVWQAWGDAGHEMIARNFNRERHYEKLMGIYRHVIHGDSLLELASPAAVDARAFAARP